MTPTQKFILKAAGAALEVAREELGKTTPLRKLEDYAVELMKKAHREVESSQSPTTPMTT